MSLTTIWATIVGTVQAVGYLKFAVIIIVDIILWKVHPVLGLIGVLLTFAFLMHWI